MGAKTPSPPAAKPQPPPSSTPSRPIHRRPPPSCRSRYPDVVVQRNRNRNALKDLAAEAEAELPPLRRRAPYQNHFDHAVLRLTAATPTSQPSTAQELFPLGHRSLPQICFPAADRGPPHHTQLLGHGFVQGSTVLHNFLFLANHKKIIGKTEGGHSTASRKRYSSSLILANLTCLLARYSSHEGN